MSECLTFLILYYRLAIVMIFIYSIAVVTFKLILLCKIYLFISCVSVVHIFLFLFIYNISALLPWCLSCHQTSFWAISVCCDYIWHTKPNRSVPSSSEFQSCCQSKFYYVLNKRLHMSYGAYPGQVFPSFASLHFKTGLVNTLYFKSVICLKENTFFFSLCFLLNI